MEARRDVIDAILEDHVRVAVDVRTTLVPDIASLADDLVAALEAGGRLLVFGNGGSAADAQHLAAELLGRFSRSRPPLAAVALTTDPSTLTAIANDFAYEDVFARQVEGLCGKHDLVVGISTSGQTANVARGLRAGRAAGARTWALAGARRGPVTEAADRVLAVPSDVTARIQEMHGVVIHAVAELVDRWAAERPARAR